VPVLGLSTKIQELERKEKKWEKARIWNDTECCMEEERREEENQRQFGRESSHGWNAFSALLVLVLVLRMQ